MTLMLECRDQATGMQVLDAVHGRRCEVERQRASERKVGERVAGKIAGDGLDSAARQPFRTLRTANDPKNALPVLDAADGYSSADIAAT
jgi:hypothetical protein